MLSNTMSFSAIINNKYLRVSHHSGQLHINDVTINMPYDICSISVSNDKIYVVYSGVRHDGFYLINSDIPLNNIEAYDFSGNRVWSIENIWNISDVIPGPMLPGVQFCEVEWYNGDNYLKCFQFSSAHNKIADREFRVVSDHEYLAAYTVMGECYTLDLTTNEIVHITSF